MRNLFMTTAFLAAFALAGNASASSLGTLSPLGNFSFSDSVSGAFSDTLDFDLSEDTTVAISITNIFLTIAGNNFNEIQGFSASVFENNTLVSTLGFSSTALSAPVTGSVQALVLSSILEAGSYQLRIDGTAATTASFSGSIVGVPFSVASPIPVPATLWLFGTALAGMIKFNRRIA